MTFVLRAVQVMCVIFAGCMLGILLQHSLPSQHIADAKSAITTIQGLVALLLALVLGLLIWTSYGVYSQQLPKRIPLARRSCNSIWPWSVTDQGPIAVANS
jgi:hypothetical protein